MAIESPKKQQVHMTLRCWGRVARREAAVHRALPYEMRMLNRSFGK